MLGDCELGNEGTFRLHPATDLLSIDALAQSCVTQCSRCSRCEALSISMQYKACSWYHRDCTATRRLVKARHLASTALAKEYWSTDS